MTKDRAPRTTRRTRQPEPAATGGDLSFTSRNYMALGGAVVAILIGYLLLSRGSVTAAPLLLVLGYCVLVPYGLASGRGRGAPESPTGE